MMCGVVVDSSGVGGRYVFRIFCRWVSERWRKGKEEVGVGKEGGFLKR